MSEKQIMQSIQLELAKIGVRLFRNNVGMLEDRNGQKVKYGLCKGSSDLIGWTLVRCPDGERAVFTAIEVKTPIGRATPEQLAFIEAVNRDGGIAFIARSSQEALEKIRGAL
jgi:hypothetical protein